MAPYPLRQLAELCRAHPLAPKILLVPGVRLGHDLTTALARSGARWTNLRVTTPVLHATERLHPEMAAAGAQRIDADGRRSLVEAALAAWPADRRAYYRRPVAGAGLGEALRKSFDDLRLALVGPERLAEQAADSDKLRDLASLFGRYCGLLSDGGWWDDAAVLVAATRRAVADRGSPESLWIVVDELGLPPAARGYVDAASAGSRHRVGRRDYGVLPPAGSAAALHRRTPIPGASRSPAAPSARSSTRTPPGSSTAAVRVPAEGLVQGDLFLDPLRDGDGPDGPVDLYAPPSRRVPDDDVEVAPGGRLLTTGLAPGDRSRVRLWQAVGVETEVRGVLRDVLRRGLALDEVEIAYTSATPYQGLLFDAAERWDLPADFARGVPSVLCRPGRSLAAFLDWVAGGLDGTTLAASLRAGDIGWEDARVPPGRVASWLLAGRVGRGELAVAEALERLECAVEAPLPDNPTRAERLRGRYRAARDRLQDVHRHVPAQDASLAVTARCASAFLDSQDLSGESEADERDRRVREGITARLRAVAEGPEVVGSRTDHARRLLEILKDYSGDPRRATAGRLHIAPLSAAGYCGRAHTYVIGLDESRFPGMASEDPVLLDTERRAVSDDLLLQRPRSSDAAFQLLRVLGSAAGEVTLVAARLHLADGREPSPTPLFEQASRQLDVEPEWVRPVPSSTEAGAVDELEGLVANRHHGGYAAAVAATHPAAARGARAQRARAGDAPTRFDGWIRAVGLEALGVQGARVLSSRMLETLAECPRRYLMRDVLGLYPLDEPPLDPRRWLQPLEMGNLLHGVFLDFMTSLQGSGDRPTPAHEPRLRELLVAAIDAARAQIPVELQVAYRNDRRRLERAAHIFLHAEAQRMANDPSLEPWALERDFGQHEAVEVCLSDRVAFRLRGRIDRVDRVGDSDEYEIWDYKTGSAYAFRAGDLLRGGRILQWALYAAALPRLTTVATVRRSGYFFASDRGSGQRFADPPPEPGRLAAVLEPLFDLADGGFFPAVHKTERWGGDACRFCDYRRVCAGEARGEGHVDEQIEGAAHAAALVEGWADTVTTRRSGSRQSLEREFDRLGVDPPDLVPEDIVSLVRDWVHS